jgi:hypothetical protein
MQRELPGETKPEWHARFDATAYLQQGDAKIAEIQSCSGANHLEIFVVIKEKCLCFATRARGVPLRQSSTAFKSTAVQSRRAEINSSVTALCILLLTCAVMFPILPPCGTRIPLASGLPD